VDEAKCLGCEQCGYACAGINGYGENRKCWNIQMVNGVAVIKNIERCRINQAKCQIICLKNCPTQALFSQLKDVSQEQGI